jgi:hypothetical protein
MTAEKTPELRHIDAYVCDLCLASEGMECHVPGCVFWLHDVPSKDNAEALISVAEAPAPHRWSADGWCFTHSTDAGPVYCEAKP